MKVNGLDIFISVSVRFTEFSSVKYDANSNIITIEFALDGVLNEEDKEEFIQKTYKCINTFHQLQKSTPVVKELNFSPISEVTLVSFNRDAHSLTEQELELLLVLLKEKFPSRIITEEEDIMSIPSSKKEIKQNLLKKINKNVKSSNNFFAYREKGKVFVFN